MVLSAIHDKQDDIPEAYRELYTEKNSKWELTGISGIKTQGDVDRVQTALTNEKTQHKDTKAKLSAWGDLVAEDTLKILDNVPALEAAAGNKLDDAKVDEIANQRAEAMVKSRTAPLERQIRTLTDENGTLKMSNGELVGERTTRKIHDAVGSVLDTAKVLRPAQSDALLHADRVFEINDEGSIVTKDQVGVTPGMSPKDWLDEIQKSKEHWWAPAKGAGSRGSGGGGGPSGENPWLPENWNMTKQGQYLLEHGQDKADAAAKAGGTTVGGMKAKPAKT